MQIHEIESGVNVRKIADEYLKIKIEMAGNPFIGFLLEQDRTHREHAKKQATEIENLKRRVDFADSQLFNAMREANKLRDEKNGLIGIVKDLDEAVQKMESNTLEIKEHVTVEDEKHAKLVEALQQIINVDTSGRNAWGAHKQMIEIAEKALGGETNGKN